MGSERRRTERLPSRLFMVFQPPKGRGGQIGRGVVLDVSHLGLAVETECELEDDVIYDCHVEMPFLLRLKVVRRYNRGVVKKYGMKIVGQGMLSKFFLKRMLRGIRSTQKLR